MSELGRPCILDDQKRAEICDLVSAGHSVAAVARLMGCNVDFVRRVSREDLPAAKVGSRLVYTRRDVEAFIARRRSAGTARPRLRQEVKPVAPAAVYDPVVHVRELLKGASK